MRETGSFVLTRDCASQRRNRLNLMRIMMRSDEWVYGVPEDTIKPVVALFCDGGVIKSNPSTIGGTWSWCGVAADGEHVREVSAYLLPKNSLCPGNPRVMTSDVTNNDCEFYAAMRALEAMKDGWSGALASDSQVTLERLRKCREGLVPIAFRMDWYSRAHCAFKRLGEVKLVYVAGHPTQKELADGWRIDKEGNKQRVSRHQQWCDSECARRASLFDDHMRGWEQTGLMPSEALSDSVAPGGTA
jgi:ribonuclease HI